MLPSRWWRPPARLGGGSPRWRAAGRGHAFPGRRAVCRLLHRLSPLVVVCRTARLGEVMCLSDAGDVPSRQSSALVTPGATPATRTVPPTGQSCRRSPRCGEAAGVSVAGREVSLGGRDRRRVSPAGSARGRRSSEMPRSRGDTLAGSRGRAPLGQVTELLTVLNTGHDGGLRRSASSIGSTGSQQRLLELVHLVE
jgi:hypothetical protein